MSLRKVPLFLGTLLVAPFIGRAVFNVTHSFIIVFFTCVMWGGLMGVIGQKLDE